MKTAYSFSYLGNEITSNGKI